MSHSVVISVVLVALGLYLLVAYSMIEKSIANLPANSNTQRANQGIFTMGITFIVSGIAFGICNYKCNCGDLQASGSIYLGFFMVLGIVLTSLAGVIVSNAHGSGKSWATTTLVIGILFVVSCVGTIAYAHKEEIASSMSSKKPLEFAFY